MQQFQGGPFGFPLGPFVTSGTFPLPVIVDDRDLLINSTVITPPAMPGPTGPTGPAGEQGLQGLPGLNGECLDCIVNTVLITEDYTATLDDYYIGVRCESPVTVKLPSNCQDAKQIIIKAEMGPPLGNRKITVVGLNNELIDGSNEHVIKTPYGLISLIWRGNQWHILNKRI